MRQFIRNIVLSAAVAGVGCGASIAYGQREINGPAATQPADARTAVPVKMVVLYSSGVGYFQHAGTIAGDATTELRFKSGQINDILKSLVLEDRGGNVSAVTYPSQDPLSKTLRSFQVDITNNPPLAELLDQLRGAKVTLVLPTEKIAGTILGVETRTKPAGENKTYDVSVVNIINGASIRSVELGEVRDIQLDSPELQDELAKALAALASARDQDKKPVTIHFKGRGQREVLLGYVVETPVWKTSYRLVLGGAAEKADDANSTPAKLQGWAIVENQTDNDWNDVQLSLVSGRPISFVEDLYQPLYIPRPVVAPQLFASLSPQTYEGGMDAKRADEAARAGGTGGGGLFGGGVGAGGGSFANGNTPTAGTGSQGTIDDFNDQLIAAGKSAKDNQTLNPTASIVSAASAANLGELFEYTVGSVSLPRQTSAMIPIVTDPIHVEKLSIFNQSVLAKHPLNGARVKNTTGKHLLAGPITVIDGSSYAGDAQINDVPPGQERFISYGIDLQMLVDAKDQKDSDELVTGKIVKGMLELTHKYVHTIEYEAENKSDRDKTLVIEHPIRGDDWKLIDTDKPIEKTDQLYRFQYAVGAGKSKKLAVKEQSVSDQGFVILGTEIDSLIAYSKNGSIPKDVKDALIKAIQMNGAVVDTQKKIDADSAREAEITQEQARIRETLKTVNQTTALYTRLMGKLDAQETELDSLHNERVDLTKQKIDQQKQLEDYLANLNVE